MKALDLAQVIAHWEVRRRGALSAAASATRNGRPALHHMRQSSRFEARINKLVRLVERASTPRSMS